MPKQTITPQARNELLRGGQRIGPGIWVDAKGYMHFSVPELLEAFGWPDDTKHRDMVHEVIREVVASQGWPAPIELEVES